MQLQFVHGWVLFLVWLVLALAAAWFLLYRQKQKSLLMFLAEPMLKKLAPSARPLRFYWQMAFVQAGLLLLLIAAARPQWGAEERIVFQRGRDLVIALDVSRSMLARDVHPSRLQRAKADIQDLLRELRGDRVALITFRGHAVQLCPLTTDYAYLEQILDDVTVESAPRGETNIGDAIEKALASFESDEGTHRAMILISDGEDLAGQAKAAAEKAKAKGIVIFTVGLGDPKGAKIPGMSKTDPYLTYQGKEVISKLQHETLKEIAEITGGAYVPVGIANVKLGKLYSEHLSKITARDLEESLQKRMIERYQWFLFPGVLLLFAGALLSRGRLATHKKPADLSGRIMKTNLVSGGAAKIFLCFLCLALVSFESRVLAETNEKVTILSNVVSNIPPDLKEKNPSLGRFPTGRQGASKAQGLYRRGAYRQSASAYLHAMSNSNRRLQNNCLFNAGCAFYRAGDYNDAVASFNRIGGEENADQGKVFYNLGCATYRLAEQSDKMGTNRPPELKPVLLEKAGNAFQHSLRVKPDSPQWSLRRLVRHSSLPAIHSSSSDGWSDGGSPGFQNAAANLAVITNILPKAREEAKLQSLMAKYGNQAPGQLADLILQNQRNIVKTLPETLTNATPARIAQFESLAEQQRINSELLIPLKMTLSSAMAAQGQAGQQQSPQIGQHLEAMQNSMEEGYNYLRDIDNRSLLPVKAAERGIYNLWKGLASFEKLLQEDIRRQTNTIAMTTSILAAADSSNPSDLAEEEEEVENIQAEQKEAHQLTQLFAERFAQAVPPEGTQAGGKLPGSPAAPLPDEGDQITSTNEAPKITREIRTNILFLAEQAIKTQTKASQFMAVTNLEASLPEQRHSYDLMKEIEKLLPKDKNQQQNQQNQDQQKQQQDQKQDQNQKQENQQPPSPPKQQPPPKKEEEQQQRKEQPSQPEQKDQKEMTPEQMRALLEKALQREKEHRDEKMRDEYIPPSPVERDW
ncbi:MAG: VWA domain-containing protein [Kiritimatiellia bacterium]|nr:VWA domain-containing protein [Kiritimatiellia bacterium]